MRSFLVGADQLNTLPTILGPTDLNLERAVLLDALRRLWLGRGRTRRSGITVIPNQVIVLAPLDHPGNSPGMLGLGHTPRMGIIHEHDPVVCPALHEHLGSTEFHPGKVTTEQWALFVLAPVVDHGCLEHACHSKIQRQNHHES